MINVIDIETIPDQRPDAQDRIMATLEAPKQYTKPASIAKWKAENAEAAYLKTALDGAYGEAVCICLDMDGEPMTLIRNDGERQLLQDLLLVLDAIPASAQMSTVWAGHCVSFDLRFLWQRACMLNVPGLARHLSRFRNARPWTGGILDTAYEWTGREFGIKLKTLCDAFGIEGNDIDGSAVWDAYQRGDIESIVHHCELDVKRVGMLLDRMGLR